MPAISQFRHICAMFRSETSYNHNTYFVIENRKFGCYLIKICIIFFSYTAIVNLLLFCPLKVYVPSIWKKQIIYNTLLTYVKVFYKKKTNDNNMCFKTLKIIPIVCRTDLILRLLKFISLKVGRYLLCRSYDIASFDPVPNHNLQNFVPSRLVVFHNWLVQIIENYAVTPILHYPGC